MNLSETDLTKGVTELYENILKLNNELEESRSFNKEIKLFFEKHDILTLDHLNYLMINFKKCKCNENELIEVKKEFEYEQLMIKINILEKRNKDLTRWLKWINDIGYSEDEFYKQFNEYYDFDCDISCNKFYKIELDKCKNKIKTFENKIKKLEDNKKPNITYNNDIIIFKNQLEDIIKILNNKDKKINQIKPKKIKNNKKENNYDNNYGCQIIVFEKDNKLSKKTFSNIKYYYELFIRFKENNKSDLEILNECATCLLQNNSSKITKSNMEMWRNKVRKCCELYLEFGEELEMVHFSLSKIIYVTGDNWIKWKILLKNKIS